MSVHAGTILTVGGANVIDRIQSAGLGDVRLPVETIREVGNTLVVDKIPTEPDFTFTMESYDVATDLMAFLTGKVGALASGSAPGAADPVGTEYKWEDCGFVNVASPWKDPTTGSAGVITAGHLVPGYYPTRARYRFGVTDFATQEVELGGGTFYYGDAAPVEEFGTLAGNTVTSSDPSVQHRIGGAGGSTFRNVFGVIVKGVLMTEGADFTTTGGNGTPVTITFVAGRTNPGDPVRFAYFTTTAKSYPQTVHASTVVKPGAVRGRNIQVFVGSGGVRQRVGSVQTVELEATVESEIEREMGSEDPVGRTINGTDVTGTMTVRAKDATAFIALLSKVTGVSPTEVIGYLNLNSMPLEIAIQNPKDPGTILKTLYVKDAIFSVPGTPARVNTPTDFAIRFDSKDGTFSEFKGAKP